MLSNLKTSLRNSLLDFLNIETRAHPSQPINWNSFLGLGTDTDSGVNVTVQGALANSVVFACVIILSDTIGILPLDFYRRLANGGKEKATGHSLFNILRWLPNPEMTSIEFRGILQGHLATWGNAYAEIEMNGAGQVIRLWPLRPDKTWPERADNDRIVYRVRLPDRDIRLPFERVMHLKGLGFDGMVGYSPIAQMRQAIGLSMATEKSGAKFFGSGMRPGSVLQHPGRMSEVAQDRLKKSVEEQVGGLTNSQRMLVLEEGLKWEQVGLPPEDSQFLESRKFQVADIARPYRIPLHMLAEMDSATFSNIEQQSLEFITQTMLPWTTRWEQAIYRDLLTERERRIYFAEHLFDALLKGDITSRYQAYNVGRQGGWLSVNDIRNRENMNPLDDGGDIYLAPLNMVPVDELDNQSIEDRSFYSGERRSFISDRRRIISSWQRIFLETISRIIRREANDIGRAAKKFLTRRDAIQFGEWLEQFYIDHKEFWQRQMLPILLSYAEQIGVNVADELDMSEPGSTENLRAFIDQYLLALAARQAGEGHLQIQALLEQALRDGEDPLPLIDERLDSWREKRAKRASVDEVHNAGNAFVKQFYILAGITRIKWRTRGKNCPFCNSLDGKVVGIQAFFLEAGVDFQPEGADRPINKRHNVGHPPIHKGCDCTIVAER